MFQKTLVKCINGSEVSGERSTNLLNDLHNHGIQILDKSVLLPLKIVTLNNLLSLGVNISLLQKLFNITPHYVTVSV